jgi:hypothetical protein
MTRVALPLVLPVLLCAAPQPVHAQRAQGAVVPEAITVGDVFHAAVRVELPPGMRVQVADSLVLPADVERAGRHEVRIDSTADGRRATILYPLAAWKPGSYQLPAARLRVLTEAGESTVSVELPSFTVRSVLPPDTAGVQPRGAKDVIGGNRVWWPLLLGLLLAALVAAALYAWWRRRRRVEPVVFIPAVPPREHALALLDALQRDGLLERGELKVFYARLAAVLRQYAAATDVAWSPDLTTNELGTRLRHTLGPVDALELVRVLGSADMVKFARARLAPATARADFDTARAWIGRVGPPAPDTGADALRAA